MTKTRTLTALLVAVALAATVGCSQKYGAERDGKKMGEAICDLREADSQEDAEEARADIIGQLDDVIGKYALYTAEDRADIENNLADLAEHAIQGNVGLMQQDLTVLERSVENIAEDSNEVAEAFWDGVREGLSDCTQS